MRALSEEIQYDLSAFLAPVLVNETTVHVGDLDYFGLDEGMNILIVILPVLCVMQVLASRLWNGCLDSREGGYAYEERQWSGELNDAPNGAPYTEAQRRRDRDEEDMIKRRASRVSISHV